VLELQHAKGGVDFAHLAVDAGGHHGDFIDKAEVFQVLNALLGFGVRADDGAAFKSIEDFGSMKAEHRQVTMAQHATTLVLHAKCVGGVVDYPQVVVVGNFLDGLHVARVTVAMHWHDGCGVRGDGSFNSGWVEVQSVGVHIHKHGFDAVPEQRMGCGHEGIRRGDDLASNTQGLQCGDQTERAVGKQRQVLDAQVVAQGFFKLLVKRPAVRQDFVGPNFLKVGNELFQRGQDGLGDIDRFVHN